MAWGHTLLVCLFYDKASFAPVYNKCYTKYVLLKLLILGDEKIGTEGETA